MKSWGYRVSNQHFRLQRRQYLSRQNHTTCGFRYIVDIVSNFLFVVILYPSPSFSSILNSLSGSLLPETPPFLDKTRELNQEPSFSSLAIMLCGRQRLIFPLPRTQPSPRCVRTGPHAAAVSFQGCARACVGRQGTTIGIQIPWFGTSIGIHLWQLVGASSKSDCHLSLELAPCVVVRAL